MAEEKKSQSSNKQRSRSFTITVNNYKENDHEKFKNIKDIRYWILGEEVASTGTKHYQGYIQFNNQITISNCVKRIKAQGIAHPKVFISNGTAQQNIDYCQGTYDKNGKKKKKNEVVHEGGEVVKGQGQRTDWNCIYDKMKDGASIEDIMSEYPDKYCKYSTGIEKMHTRLRIMNAQSNLKAKMEKAKLRPWQEDVVKKVKAQSDRTVTWVYDEKGNAGKTFLAKKLLAEGDTFYCQNGKSADIAYAYNYERTVVFDFTRSQEERVNYGIIESFKNGILFSPKYVSTQKLFDSCQVLVLANFYPDKSKLSNDRWDIVNLGDGPQEQIMNWPAVMN